MTGRGEPNWQPISMLATIASLSDEGLRDAREHYATLLEARPKAHVRARLINETSTPEKINSLK